MFLGGAIAGMSGGVKLKCLIPTVILRKLFAISVLVIAVAMIVQTLSGTP